MTLDEHFEWLEHYAGGPFYLNCFVLMREKEMTMTAVQQRAWIAYYTTMRDDPEADAEEKRRAIEMLETAQLIGIEACELV